MSKSVKDKKFTTSKKILWASFLIFVVTLAVAVKFSYDGRDTSVFMYALPITGGIAGTTTVFYLNKSKMENIFRFKISFLEYKLDLIDSHPDKKEVIENEMSSVEGSLDSKIDTAMQEAVSEDINIQNY